MPRPKKPDTTSATNSDAAAVPAIAARPPAEMDLSERIEQTVQWMLSGAREADVVEAIRQHWPDQDLQPLIVGAVENLAKSAEFEADVVRGWCFEATKLLYQKMSAIGDFAGALRAVKQMHDMAGR